MKVGRHFKVGRLVLHTFIITKISNTPKAFGGPLGRQYLRFYRNLKVRNPSRVVIRSSLHPNCCRRFAPPDSTASRFRVLNSCYQQTSSVTKEPEEETPKEEEEEKQVPPCNGRY
jgi:hypothetical protein